MKQTQTQTKKLASNMTEVTSRGAKVLISYETPVAIWREGGPVATEDRYSQTTQKHITKWLRIHGSGLTSSNVPRISGDAFRFLCKHYEIG